MKIKKLIICLYIFSLLILGSMGIISRALRLNFNLESIYYWVLFPGIIIFFLFYKLKSSVYLTIGFSLFLLATFLLILGLKTQAEFLFRNGFLFFFFGYLLSLREYRNGQK